MVLNTYTNEHKLKGEIWKRAVDCIHINMLVVILNTVFQDVIIKADWVKVTQDLCIISYNCMWIFNYFKVNKNINFKKHLPKNQKQHNSCGPLLPTELKCKLFSFKFLAACKQIPNSLSNPTFHKSAHRSLIIGYSCEFRCLLLHSAHPPHRSPHSHTTTLPSFKVHLQMARPAGRNPSTEFPRTFPPCIAALHILVLYSPQSYELSSDGT